MNKLQTATLRNSPLKVGVLGGIGVDASVYFYKMLIEGFRKRRQITSNTQYPQIMLNSAPLPELHLDEHDTTEIVGEYTKAVRDVAATNPDFLVMVCNTVHLYLSEMVTASNGVPILNLPKIVNDRILKEKHEKYCILGTGLTVSRNLYGELNNTIKINKAEYELICQAVVDYNNGGSLGDRLDINKEIVKGVVAKKRQEGATRFIYACTEVSEIMFGEDDIPSLDTMEVLIEATLDALTGQLSECYFSKWTVNSKDMPGEAGLATTSIL